MAMMLNDLIKRRTMLEEGIIPFVEPNSIEEDLAFNELFFIKRQIDAVIKFEKDL